MIRNQNERVAEQMNLTKWRNDAAELEACYPIFPQLGSAKNTNYWH